jgi:hypothetical protein
MIKWIIENKEWFLDGLGIFILGLFVSFIVWLVNRKGSSSKGSINQGIGNNSKAEKVSFTNIKQIVNSKSENKEE